MSLINVAIVAVDGFSPFHYSVPCILFGDSVSGEKRFNVTICAETPLPHLKRRVRPQRHAGLHRHWSGRYSRCSLLAARPRTPASDAARQPGAGERQRRGNRRAVSGVVCAGLCGHSRRQARCHPLGVRKSVPVALSARPVGYQCPLRG